MWLQILKDFRLYGVNVSKGHGRLDSEPVMLIRDIFPGSEYCHPDLDFSIADPDSQH
jgi:hypothetical protein